MLSSWFSPRLCYIYTFVRRSYLVFIFSSILFSSCFFSSARYSRVLFCLGQISVTVIKRWYQVLFEQKQIQETIFWENDPKTPKASKNPLSGGYMLLGTFSDPPRKPCRRKTSFLLCLSLSQVWVRSYRWLLNRFPPYTDRRNTTRWNSLAFTRFCRTTDRFCPIYQPFQLQP